jgi:hypothetical protein
MLTRRLRSTGDGHIPNPLGIPSCVVSDEPLMNRIIRNDYQMNIAFIVDYLSSFAVCLTVAVTAERTDTPLPARQHPTCIALNILAGVQRQ